MKLTDEMVEAAAKAQHHERYPWVVWENLKPQSREYYRNEVRVAVTAAFAHLTDDGAAATPPADTGVRSAPAAESATPVGAGSAAPSSPHREYAISVLVDLLQEANKHDIAALERQGWPGIPEVPDHDMRIHCGHLIDALIKFGVVGEVATPAVTHRPTCGTTYGESCDGYCPTPAIDREALTELLRFNRHAPYVSNERLADMVAALIEGAS